MSSLNNNLKLNTKRYLELQSQIQTLQQQINQLKEEKKQTENNLIYLIQQNNLQKHAITYQGHKVFMKKEASYDTLTFKFLELCLNKLYPDREQVKKIIQFIKKQRQKSFYYCIKNS